MQSLFEDGVIYMNTLEFYRTLEADYERRDVKVNGETFSFARDLTHQAGIAPIFLPC
ncbi:hypothetical protein [Pseudidiomarina mangrovi]|uniref:hypothetical protein n=1 Tax=Pseudidiomarina mangrovi TaxID=2487133 RepID=UPI0013DEB4D7|nr:hypothetical protein [Pseudidiomarina mangrovi]